MIVLAAVVGILFILVVFILALAIFTLADALAHQSGDDIGMMRMAARKSDAPAQPTGAIMGSGKSLSEIKGRLG